MTDQHQPPPDHIEAIIEAHWHSNRQAIIKAMAAPNPRVAHIYWSEARHHQQAAILLDIGSIRDQLVIELQIMQKMATSHEIIPHIEHALKTVLKLDKIGQRPEPPPLKPEHRPQPPPQN